jgi:hypothetical protein
MKRNIFASVRSLFGAPKTYVNARKTDRLLLKDLSHYLAIKPFKTYRHTTDRKTFKSF